MTAIRPRRRSPRFRPPSPSPKTVRHWPGGIPVSVRVHPDSLSNDEMREAVKGWLLFVSVHWVSRQAAGISEDEDPDYELRQRRSLVERWATADQTIRDGFHERAPLPETPRDYCLEARERVTRTSQPSSVFMCLAPVDQQNPDFKGEGVGGVSLPSVVLEPNPYTVLSGAHGDFAKGDFLAWKYIEPADFARMSMTRWGTVIFLSQRDFYWIVDQKGLETGILSYVYFGVNGQVFQERGWRAYHVPEVECMIEGLGWPLSSLQAHYIWGTDEDNPPMNMDAPVLEILQKAWDDGLMRRFRPENPSQFPEKIDRWAPGYLALEAEGRALDYDPVKMYANFP
ncbi:hypothetical protein BO94DRAFT_583393 [Aspergillus sclerotioniger CBS 115572]|uniref:Uncharacterized protein n=1 Tax=Aspergillus sclerotioniger CBS 115572 TaxID=1450535 RepID=A0A317X3K7_9EURO|nr:hypothetical protein BO94DRAFT_583393 [Aspergillus sclerotioniger CBS 115572]PWY93153.1 hypothetical protein BO94DRAFT_583393 [Aspergillus sclerotioniger CBS 115572]